MKLSNLMGLAVVVAAAGSAPALALEAKVSKQTPAKPDVVWAAVGNFCGIANWHPAVAKCAMSTKDSAIYLTLTLKDGAELYEKQVSFDAVGMTYSYTIEKGPLPVDKYTSTIKVTGSDQGSTIDWSGNFDAKGAADDEVVKIITGIYGAGVDALVAQITK